MKISPMPFALEEKGEEEKKMSPSFFSSGGGERGKEGKGCAALPALTEPSTGKREGKGRRDPLLLSNRAGAVKEGKNPRGAGGGKRGRGLVL